LLSPVTELLTSFVELLVSLTDALESSSTESRNPSRKPPMDIVKMPATLMLWSLPTVTELVRSALCCKSRSAWSISRSAPRWSSMVIRLAFWTSPCLSERETMPEYRMSLGRSYGTGFSPL